MSVPIYVVQRGYDFEGDMVVWAGLDFEEAMKAADAIEGGDTITVVRCNPEPGETWARYREDDVLVYTHYDVNNKALGTLDRTK